jgi:hypothetical protein
MRLHLTYVALALVGCSDTLSTQNEAVIEQIEQSVKLPEGAGKLEDYARYYAAQGDNIVGVYTDLVDHRDGDHDLPTGKRRWLTDSRDLPVIMDGGCSVVEVTYNSATKKVEEIFCHGEA